MASCTFFLSSLHFHWALPTWDFSCHHELSQLGTSAVITLQWYWFPRHFPHLSLVQLLQPPLSHITTFNEWLTIHVPHRLLSPLSAISLCFVAPSLYCSSIYWTPVWDFYLIVLKLISFAWINALHVSSTIMILLQVPSGGGAVTPSPPLSVQLPSGLVITPSPIPHPVPGMFSFILVNFN